MVKRELAAFIFLFLALSALFCQGRRRVMSLLSMERGGDQESWVESLDATLASSSLIGEVRRASPGGDAVEEAARLGFDLAVLVSVEGEGEAASASWALYPVYASPSPEGPRAPTAMGRARVGQAHEGTFWLGLVMAADKLLSETPAAGTARLRVVAPPGARIKGLSKEPVIVPDSGALELRLRSPSSYAWRASLQDCEDETGLLSVAGMDESLCISFRPRRRESLETGLVKGSFPDLWFSWRFALGRFFARVGLIQYLAGLSLKDEDSSMGERPYLVSLARFEPGIGLGCYLSPPDDTARLYISVDSAFRIAATEKDNVLTISRDSAGPVEIKPALGLEWTASSLFNLFFEMGTSIYPTRDGESLASELSPSDNNHTDWPHVTADYCVAEFFIVRFGARFPL